MGKNEIEGLPAAQLIERYGIMRASENRLRASAHMIYMSGDDEQTVMSVLKARKAEVLSCLSEMDAEEKAAAEEHQRKIDAIPGLKELDAAYADLEAWDDEFERSFENCGGLGVRPRPKYNLEEMAERYPAAAAYRKARSEAYKTNAEISAYGRQAMKMIEDDPQNYSAALQYMERENKAFVERHIWD